MARFISKALPIAAILSTLVLFTLVLTLQSRWIAQLSDADLQRSRLGLKESLRMVKLDVNRQITAAHA